MTRRGVVGALLGMSLRAAEAPATAVVLDATSGRVLDSRWMEEAAQVLAPPGSTLKPLILTALLDSGKLRPAETMMCSGHLTIGQRSFACSHPPTNTPIDLQTAIAYSCNEYVAKMAQRFTPTEQLDVLRRYGLGSRTNLSASEAAGKIQLASGNGALMQALGEQSVEVSLLELAAAYRKLASAAPMAVREGMENAVEFGTAQNAMVKGIKVAGKTGSAHGRWAWFAGFAPSTKPRFVVAVRTRGSSGGADAAPIAAELFTSAFRRYA